jgi:putative sterol carrier protein
MVLYPTEEWLIEYKHRINENEALDIAGVKQEVNITGNFLFVITDVPLNETTIGDLPNEVFDGLPRHLQIPLSLVALDGAARPLVRSLFTTIRCVGRDITLNDAAILISGSLRQCFPERTEDLLRQLDEHVIDGTIYVFIGLEEGDCTEVEILGGLDERTVDFVLRGSHKTWREIVNGDLDFLSAVSSGDLEVEGETQRSLRYSGTMQLLAQAAADIETTHLF